MYHSNKHAHKILVQRDWTRVYTATYKGLSSQPNQNFLRSLWHTKFPKLVFQKHAITYPQQLISESPLLSSWSRFNDVATCSHLRSLALKAVLKMLTKGLDGKNLNVLNPEIYWHDPRSTHTIEPHTWLPGSLASRNPTWMLFGPKSLHLGKRTLSYLLSIPEKGCPD